MKTLKSFSHLKKELLADREVRQVYEALGPEYMVIRAIIRKRQERKMSQKELAAKIGTRQSAISRLESGNANPSLGFLQKIAKALNTRLEVSFR